MAAPAMYAECKNPNHKHEDKIVVRCAYTQEDIYRAFCNNPRKYEKSERYKRCFYCGCKIDEHSKDKE